MAVFTAAFPGHCDDCGGQVLDTECVRDATGAMSHVDCPDEATDELSSKPVCPRCWLILPAAGECLDCKESE